MLTVVTSFSLAGYNAYGCNFVETFKRYWPDGVRLLCYWEGEQPDDVDEGFDLLSTQPCESFLRRHSRDPMISGREPTVNWGPKARAKGYSFRHDAYKFARKVFAVAHAAREIEFGKLFWVDADVRTLCAVPESLLEDLLPDDVALCYLPRPGYHSELGFVGYNLMRLEAHAFIAQYEAVYAADKFKLFRYWDDCSIFDLLVQGLKPRVHPIAHTSRSQPFDNSILGAYMTHDKGSRKAA